jgi:flagellar hook-length control protein FliK
LLASGGTHAFARALKSALAPPSGAPAEAEGETAQAELGVRQKLAGDGKGLPESPEGEADEKADKSEDVAFAWFGGAFVLPQPAPALPRPPVGARAIQLPEGQIPAGKATALPGTVQVPAADPSPVPADPAAPEAAVQAAAAVDARAIAVAAAPAPAPEPKPPISAVAPESQPAVERTAGRIRIELPPAQPHPATLASIQPRAEAIHAAAAAIAPTAIEAPAPRRQTGRETTLSSLTAPAATQTATAQAVPATADAQQPALDLRSRDGLQAMVDRIEALRDTPNTRETSIRLSPDALGTVDISIRHEGDRVHVHFTADSASARAALAEAQPRLAELAEARGLRLGQTSVDGGGAGQGQRHTAAPNPVFTTAPASALDGEPATDSDDRVA